MEIILILGFLILPFLANVAIAQKHGKRLFWPLVGAFFFGWISTIYYLVKHAKD